MNLQDVFNSVPTQADILRKSLGLEPLTKAGWSDSAREAAAAARKKAKTGTHEGQGDLNFDAADTQKLEGGYEDAAYKAAQQPQDQMTRSNHQTVGSKNASDETRKTLAVTSAMSANSPWQSGTTDGGPAFQTAHKAHYVATHQAMKADKGFARDVLETHLTGLKGVRIEHGKDGTVKVHDKLFGATGTASISDDYKSPISVTLNSDRGHSVTASSFKSARIKMKRMYYGGVPNKTLKEQGITGDKMKYGVGHRAGTKG